MNRRKIIYIGIPVFLGLTITIFAIWFINHGFSAREEPTRVEALVARNVRNLSIPSGAKKLKSPRQLNEADITAASEHFAMSCAMCHGTDGRGKTSIGQYLYPKAPDMTKADTQLLTDGELYYIILNGVRFTGMPAWSEDSTDEIWSLVAFIRRTPKLSPEEVDRLTEIKEGRK